MTNFCFRLGFQFPKGQLDFVDRWPLMNANEIVFIIGSYLVFVLKLGSVLMEDRSPFQLKRLLICYNVLKVFNCAVLAYKFFSYIMDKGLFPRKCEHDEITLYTIAMLYWKYMVTKVLDLGDTIFFILRKKYDQLTFLHVYHHSFMVVVTWWCLKYDPSDHWAFMAVSNCIIHGIMYTYYGMSALGPKFARLLWWKRYLTMLQLVQFTLIFLHISIQTYTSDCPMKTGTYWIGLANLVLFIFLFTDFYKRRYSGSKSKDVGFACSKHCD